MATIGPGGTVTIKPGEEIQLTWECAPGVYKVEVQPITDGDRGDKLEMFQPRCMYGMLYQHPKSNTVYTMVAYPPPHASGDLKPIRYSYNVNVEGSKGLLLDFYATGSTVKALSGEEMEVSDGEPVTFRWIVGPNCKHLTLTRVGDIANMDARHYTLPLNQQMGGLYELTAKDAQGTPETLSLTIKVSSEPYKYKYPDDLDDYVENNPSTLGLNINGDDRTKEMLQGFWVTSEEDDKPHWSIDTVKGTPVTLHWRIGGKRPEAVEIHSATNEALENVPKPNDTLQGILFNTYSMEAKPDIDTSYTITVRDEDFKTASASVVVSVHAPGEVSGEKSAYTKFIKFTGEQEFPLGHTSGKAGEYGIWDAEFGVKFTGTLTREAEAESGGEDAPEAGIEITNLTSIKAGAARKFKDKWSDPHSQESITLPNGEKELGYQAFEVDPVKGEIKVGIVELTYKSGSFEGKIEGALLSGSWKHGEVKVLEVGCELAGTWTRCDFDIGPPGWKAEDVGFMPYLKFTFAFDLLAAIGKKVEQKAEEEVVEKGALAGADAALALGAVAICVIIVAETVISMERADAFYEASQQSVFIQRELQRGYKAGLAGQSGGGSQWFVKGCDVASETYNRKKQELRKLKGNKDMSQEDFDTAFQKALKDHQTTFEDGKVLDGIAYKAREVMWKKFVTGQGYIDGVVTSYETERYRGWVNIFGGDPSAGDAALFHLFDNNNTHQSYYPSGLQKKNA